MGKGSNRNKTCWCGSGKKYKNCHEIRESEEKVKLHEVDNDLRSSFNKKRCMAPSHMSHECSRSIIKAHTISKSSNLKQIAVDGHVLGFKKGIQTLDKNSRIFPVERIGVNNASIFLGFCDKHDKELFSVIEDQEFLFSKEQIFTLAYRAICRELYLKYSSSDFNQKKRDYDKGRSPLEQLFMQNQLETWDIGTDLAIRDLEIIKKTYDDSISKKDFTQIQYYCIVINSIPEIMCSGVWAPEIDFNNNKLANLSDSDLIYNSITVSTIALSKSRGAIIFAWHGGLDSKYCSLFIESLNNIPNTAKAGAILKYLFEFHENIFFSEKWWNNLSEKYRKMLINSMMNVGFDTQFLDKILAMAFNGIPNDELIFDIEKQQYDLKNSAEYNKLLSWHISEIKTNIL